MLQSFRKKNVIFFLLFVCMREKRAGKGIGGNGGRGDRLFMAGRVFAHY